jgi:hypothetical protein
MYFRCLMVLSFPPSKSVPCSYCRKKEFARQAMYVYRNVEARSRNHCCLGKEISIKYSEFGPIFLPYLSGMQSACAVLYCHLWPVWLYHIFPHYLISNTIFGEKIIVRKTCVLILSTTLSESFFILRRIYRDIDINLHGCSCNVSVILVRS